MNADRAGRRTDERRRSADRYRRVRLIVTAWALVAMPRVMAGHGQLTPPVPLSTAGRHTPSVSEASMASTHIPARRIRRVLLGSLGVLAATMLGTATLTACGAPTTSPGLVVPTVPSPDAFDSSSMNMPMSVDSAAPVVVLTTTAPPPPPVRVTTPAHTATHAVATHPATTHAVVRPAPTHEASACSGDYYLNSDGSCVHRPEQAPTAPTGATAKCEDGTYSFSKHHSGTCSGHGGVAEFL
jgi:hypothetical protein